MHVAFKNESWVLRPAPPFQPSSGERRERVAALQALLDRPEHRLLVPGPAHAPIGLATMHGLQDVPAAAASHRGSILPDEAHVGVMLPRQVAAKPPLRSRAIAET